jgi:hypothetical protein
MRMNMGRATYSHFSIVAHTDEAMLFPAGRLENRVMPTKPTINRENPTQMPVLRARKRTPKTTRDMLAMLASIRPPPLRSRWPQTF